MISWEQWMAQALYQPGRGYYSANIVDVGARGDFSTSVTLGGELACGVSRWIWQRAGELGWRGRIPLIEMGPGNGALARGIWQSVPFWRRQRLDFHLVDTSPPLREIQRRTLRGCRVTWHDDMTSALRVTGGRALIYSNELVDAFPCRCFIRRAGTWKELGVQESAVCPEAEMETTPAETEALESSGFAMLGQPREGQRIEVHSAYRDWLLQWVGAWCEGSMLTVDYGYLAEPAPRLPLSGTVRAYFQQMCLEGEEVYRRKGLQDLTADVNFTDVQRWGEALGWQTGSLQTQADWLRSWVPSDGGRLAEAGNAGGAFWVLEQKRISPETH